MKGDLLERGIFKYEVSLSVTLAEFLTSHHRAAHSPDAVLDVQCSGNVPLGKLHCPVINLNNQLHSIGSTVNFYEISSQCEGHLKNLVWACCVFLWDSFLCTKCTNFSQPEFVWKIKGAMWQKLFSITTGQRFSIPPRRLKCRTTYCIFPAQAFTGVEVERAG